MERDVVRPDTGCKADSMQVEADGPRPQGNGPELFFIHLVPRSPNQEQTLLLAHALREECWSVHIICRESCALVQGARDRGLAVHTVPDKVNNGFFAAWKVMRTIRKQCRKAHGQEPGSRALVHACDLPASQLASQVWRLDKKLRVVHTRRIPIMEQHSKSIRCYLTPPAKIITDSLAGKIALRLSGVESHLLHTISCGIDPSCYPHRRERHDGRTVFAVTGELLPGWGHSLLFDALAALAPTRDVPPWEVRIIGEGPHFSSLLQEAEAKHISGNLAFLGGTDMDGKLRDCDILVLPADEGESHVPFILRGWAQRVPIIAINRLDHAEILRDEENCLFVQPGDAAGLAAQMARLANDGALRARLVAGGTASLAQFSLKEMVLEHKRLYRQILA